MSRRPSATQRCTAIAIATTMHAIHHPTAGVRSFRPFDSYARLYEPRRLLRRKLPTTDRSIWARYIHGWYVRVGAFPGRSSTTTWRGLCVGTRRLSKSMPQRSILWVRVGPRGRCVLPAADTPQLTAQVPSEMHETPRSLATASSEPCDTSIAACADRLQLGLVAGATC